jgi:hypothetical protein
MKLAAAVAAPAFALTPGKFRFTASIAVLRAKKTGQATHIRVTCKAEGKTAERLQPYHFHFNHELSAEARSLVSGQKFPSRSIAGIGKFVFKSRGATPPAYEPNMTVKVSRNQEGELTVTLPWRRVFAGDESCMWAFTTTFSPGWEDSTLKNPSSVEVIMVIKAWEELEAVVPQKRAMVAASSKTNKASTIICILELVIM